MAKVRRIDWSPDEWIAGTAGLLTQREAGVYMTVLMAIYSRGGGCPNDASFIAGRFKADGESKHRQAFAALTAHTRRALDRLIELGKLNVSADGLWLTNDRADLELNKARERIDGATKAGVASGVKRGRGTPQPTPSQPPPNPLPNPHPMGAEISNINDLTRTSVRITNYQPSYESYLSKNLTDAARDPALNGGSGPRARRETMKERMAALAALNRRKFLA